MNEPTLPEAASRLPESIDLDGLFILDLQLDGSYSVSYGPVTAPRELALRWKLQPENYEVALAFHGILANLNLEVFSTNIPRTAAWEEPEEIRQFKLYSVAQHAIGLGRILAQTILEPLSKALGEDLKTIADIEASPSAVRKAKNRIQLRVSKALDAVEKKSRNKAHGHAKTGVALIGEGEGVLREMPIPWIALEVAKRLVGERGELPSKAELELILCERVPEAALLAESTWSKIWRDSGLTALPESEHWKARKAEKKKALRSKAKEIMKKRQIS